MKASFLTNLIDYCLGAYQGIKQIKNFRPSMMRKVFSLMGKREKIIFGTLSGLAIISLLISFNNLYISVTKPAPAVGGEYREGMLGQPRLINPLLATSSTDNALVHLIFSGLYKYDGSGNLIPDLAEGMPQISPDQKQYTVHLKKSVKWHNDKLLTAEDVVFTIKTLQDPAFKSPARSAWTRTTVDKIDDYTVLFTNKDISAPFLDNLTQPIMPKAVWGKVSADTFVLSGGNLEAIGSGPYVIKEIKKLPTGKVQTIKLESFSNFYTGKPYIEHLVFNFYDSSEEIINALHSKEIGGFGFIPLDESLYLDKENPDLSIREIPLPQYQAVLFNMKSPGLSDSRIRKALSLITDKAKVLNEVFNNQGRIIDGPVLPQELGDSYQVKNQIIDVEQSKKLLDAAGWKIDPATNLRTKNKNILEISLATNDSPLNTKTAEIIMDEWKSLGIKVSLNVLPNRELSDNLIRPRKFDALLFSQNLGSDPDPFAFWHSSQTKDPGLNITGFSNSEADKLVAEARATFNNKERQGKYLRFTEVVNSEAPAIFLNETVFVYAVSKKVKNVTLQNLYDPANRFYDITNWYIEETRVWK